MLNTNNRVPEELAGNTSTKERISGIEKVLKTHQNFTTVKKLDMSRKTVTKESRKKNQGPTTTKE